ncbi:MAG: hypothetical protein A3I68_08100 [Candidatus Melainabacteria bacterium RIFCSPLOWO2_02_FULL_35_15]|nr:MAG: hypothetical protein A3F80_08325 [Candidatus Melainabacteria bacterium RIFCSPLOWO2_12_FULL_35_11]OGI13940.1 MAG: hypothetical protein A3I68_08100 [Candidatus Melainabacteria bacterium RIFCSPLOWO2_02_FULL_35_15]
MGIKSLLEYLTAFILVFISFAVCSSQAKSINPEEMKSQIKYITEINGIKEFELPNGLKVLLKSNRSVPLVTFSIWYKVGSRNETAGQYGLAHFLEHMMFKGTKKLKKGEISATIQGLGGVYNAFTSSDGTAYYETISPKYLEKVIEIESDRIKNSTLDQNELNLERTVVLSELEGDLNNPATHLDQKVRGLAYEISPYKHPTIGYEKEVENISPEMMREFYKKFYSPNNAAIVLAGDFNEATALNLITKYFGEIKNDTGNIYDSIPKEKEQIKEKRTIIKRAGSFKILEIVYHVTDTKDNDIYPLNVLEEILIKGKKSPLKKKLIEKGLATEVSGGTEANRDPGLFQIAVSLTPKATHKKVEKIILNEIDKLIQKPSSKKEIEGAINRIKASYLFGLDGTYNQALNIGYFEVINNWKQSQYWIDEISKVTQKDITKVLNKYFKKQNRTIGYFIPKLQKGERYEALPINTGTVHNYKKTSPTEKAQTFTTNLFKYEKIHLQDNSDLLLYKDIDLPITYISGVIKGGSSLLPKDKEWYCQLITRTLEKGSKKYTKEEIEEILDNTGSQINFSCDEESFKFTLASINDNLPKSIDLLFDILMNPLFPKEEIEKEKEKLTAEINESRDNTSENASRRFSQIIYPSDHPYCSNTFPEDISLIKKIDIKKIKDVHNSLIRKNKAIITLVSNLNNNELINQINDSIDTGKPKEEGEINIPDTLLRENSRTETIVLKDKMQSDVFLGHAGNLKRTDPDFYKMNIANYILGGSSLSSRLSKRVRDNSGLTYTIYSYINSSHGKGEFAVYFGSNNTNVDKALELTKDELKKFVNNGITEEELKRAKASLIDSFVSRNLSTYKNIASTLSGIEFYNLGENYINDYPGIINSLKLDEINIAIKKYIHPEKLNTVIAGEYKNSK